MQRFCRMTVSAPLGPLKSGIHKSWSTLDRFREMVRSDLLAAGQIGDGAGQLEQLKIRP
jgi:hypothetical protein